MDFTFLSDRALYTNPKADFVYSQRVYETNIVDTKKLRKKFLESTTVSSERRVMKISSCLTEGEGLVFVLTFKGSFSLMAICDLEIRHATNIKRVEFRSNSVALFSKSNPEHHHTIKLDAIDKDDCLIVGHHHTFFCELSLFVEYYEKPNPLKVLNFSFVPLSITYEQADKELADLTSLIGDADMRESLSIISRHLFKGLDFFTGLPDGDLVIYKNGFLGLHKSNEGFGTSQSSLVGGMIPLRPNTSRDSMQRKVEWIVEILYIGYCYLQDLPISLEAIKDLLEKRKLVDSEPLST